MTPDNANLLAVLERIAEFSASVRGHELGEWQTRVNSAQAHCIRCGAGLRVYCWAIQPELVGETLDCDCGVSVALKEAA
jgi:hypothetical protein